MQFNHNRQTSGQRGMSQARQRRKKRGKIISKWSKAPNKKDIQIQQPLDQIDQKIKDCQSYGNIIPQKLRLMQRLNKASKNIIPAGQRSMMTMGFNPSVVSLLTEGFRIKHKITLPHDPHCNFMGLLIGPSGSNQKKLQQMTGCKVLVRGKGSQKQGQLIGVQQEGQLHVLVVGNNQLHVARACTEVQRIIFSNQSDRNKLRDDQLKLYREMNTKNQYQGSQALSTPYGTPSTEAFAMQVPNQCVGMIIGKDGLTLKMIQQKSGALKVLVATSSAGIDTRNVFVQGDQLSIQRARKIIEGMVDTHQHNNITTKIQSSYVMDMQVPNSLVGLVIGKNGQNIKGINGKTGAFVSLAKQQSLNFRRKIIRITGPQNLCYAARYQVDMIVQNGLKNLQNTRSLTPDQMSMIKPVQFYPQQFQGVSFVDSNQESSNHYMLQQLSMNNPAISKMLFQQISPPCTIQVNEVVSRRK